MVDRDSDDYELMPSHELDEIRREVNSLKRGSMVEGDKAKMIVDSMDRLSTSINRLITILDDAQKDIIDEYQESKPAEKLNQLLEQNEMIAKALIAISDNFNNGNNTGSNSGNNNGNSRGMMSPSSQYYAPGAPSMPTQDAPMSNPRGMFPPSNNQMNQQQMNSPPPMNQFQMSPPMMNQQPMNPPPMNQFQMNQPPMFDSQGMSSMDDLPPMDTVPPLDGQMPSASKKKFLGIM